MDRNDPPPSSAAAGSGRPHIRLTGTEQSEHDALAELFLGDAPFAPLPMDARTTPERPPARDPAPQSTPTPTTASRFEGSAVRSARAERVEPDRDTEHTIVELVILGHLPVRASLWVRQYACLSARKRNETVSLVRSAGGLVSIDVITGHQPAEIEPVDSIEDGVTIATHAAPRVILRVDETAEPDLLERDGIDEVTILTGADEAAVVASYRLIKTLVASLDDRLDPEAAPRVRVAVMGNPGPEIEAARLKIAKACKAFLDRPVEILDASGRIDATGTVTVCRSDEPDATASVLDALLGRGDRARDTIPISITPSALRLTDARADRPHDDAPQVVVMPQRTPGPSTDERPEVSVVADRVVEPKPIRLREPLACLIEGLTPIEARCPGAPGVELACDQHGLLHAVCTDDRGPGEAVSALLVASAWANANLPLLIRAEPALAMPSSDPADACEPVLHLLARQPSLARGVLDTEVLVYALASVVAGGEEIMVATPLNEF